MRDRTLMCCRWVLTIVSILVTAIAASAQDPPPPEEPPSPPTLSDRMLVVEREVDEAHDSIQRDILERVIRFDNFFGNINTEEQRRTRYELRWRNGLRIEEGGRIRPGISTRANVTLTGISERLRLAIFGEDRNETTSQGLPVDPGTPGFDRTTRSANLVNTELRYSLLQTTNIDWFTGLGVRIRIPPDMFLRTRFQYTHNVTENTLAHFRETLYLKNMSEPGETTEIDLERPLDRDAILRLSTSGTASSEISGLEWGSELSLLLRLSQKSATTFLTGIYGNTRESGVINNYKVMARYRSNFLRSWLFYELAPEITWPRNAQGIRHSQIALTALLEIVFQGSRSQASVSR